MSERLNPYGVILTNEMLWRQQLRTQKTEEEEAAEQSLKVEGL